MRMSQPRSGARLIKIGAVTTAAAVGATLAATATPAYAAVSLSQSQVAAAGGSMLYFTGGTAFPASAGVRFVTPTSATCPATYDAALTGTVDGGAWTQVTANEVARITTPALVAGTSYKPCIYDDATTGDDYTTDVSAGTVYATNMGHLSKTNSTGSTTVTLTMPSAVLTGTTYTTQFVSASTCNTTYTAVATGTIVAATTTKTSTSMLTITVPTTLTASTAYRVCIYNGTTAGTSALQARSHNTLAPYTSTLPVAVMAPTGGSSGTATTVTLTAPSAVFSGTPATLVARDTCPTTYAAGATLEPYAATTAKISTSKVAVTIPDDVVVGGGDVSTPWNVCVYASSSSGALVLAPSTYNVAPVLDVSSASLSPASGPAQGGSAVTITGLTGIPTAAGATLSATLGGSAITNITAIDSTSFTGTTSAHAAGPVNLIVTTAAGSKTKAVSGSTPYLYTYGLTVFPNTSPNTTNPTLDILGAGFSELTFTNIADGDAVDASEAHVVLTDNAWNAQTFDGNDNVFTTDSIMPETQCKDVLPISDGEIVCTLDLANTFSATTQVPEVETANVADGTYTVTVVNDGTIIDSDEYNHSIVSSSSTFTVASF